MLNVLFAADFPIAKSGIASTAASILAEDQLGPNRLFSDNPLLINNEPTQRIEKLGQDLVDLVFTHMEYSDLPALQCRYPEAIFHVGDWPLRHWKSVQRAQPLKGTLAKLRCLWRLNRINRDTRLAFVTQEDCEGAIAHGFSRALHLPIGVKIPKKLPRAQVDVQSICFSGNFRYQPNRDAAQRLLDLARNHSMHHRIILVGFYADDFKGNVGSNVEIYPDVPLMVDFLAIRRPIYVSLINTGAGAKNKILEAMVAGCPIICTPESLDSSIPQAPTIKIVSSEEDVLQQLANWNSSGIQTLLTKESNKLAVDTRMKRSWYSVASILRDLISLPSV